MNISTRGLALLAGTLFALTAALDIPHDQPDVFASQHDYVLEAAFALSLAAAALTFISLARSATRLPAQIGFAVAGTGAAILMVVASATHVQGRDALDVLFPVGLLAMLLGQVALAVADVRGAVRPRYGGLILAASSIAMIVLGEGYGLIAWSAGWYGLAALMSSARPPAKVADGSSARAETAAQ